MSYTVCPTSDHDKCECHCRQSLSSCVLVSSMPSHNIDFAMAACNLSVFGFVLADFVHQCSHRDIQVVEIWSGVGAIVRAAEMQCLLAVPFDKHRVPGVTDTRSANTTEDILTRAGFLRAANYVLRLVEGGLLWMAPVCSSFVFMNASRCKRSAANDFRGDVAYGKVADGNHGADIACFLFWLAWARGVEVALENPRCSVMWKYPGVVSLRASLQLCESLTHRCAWDTRPYGKRFLKPYKFLATGAWIENTSRPCKCPGKLHLSMVVHESDGRVTGDSGALAKSAAYPLPLGKAIVAAWMGASTLARSSAVPVLPAQDTTSPGVPVSHTQGKSKRRRWQKASQSSSEDDEGAGNNAAKGSRRLLSLPQRAQHWTTLSPTSDTSRDGIELQPASSKRRKWLSAVE